MKEPYHLYEPGEDPERDHSRFRWLAAGGFAYLLVRKWRRRRRSRAPVDEEVVRRGHQPADELSVKSVTAFAAALLVMLMVVSAGAAMLMKAFDAMEEPRTGSPFAEYDGRSDEHPLQADPSAELREVRAREQRLLHASEWVDSTRGVARIPIDSAMNRLSRGADSTSRVEDSVRVLTESGWVIEPMGVPAPSFPAYDAGAPEDFAVSPEIARILGIITTTDDRPQPE